MVRGVTMSTGGNARQAPPTMAEAQDVYRTLSWPMRRELMSASMRRFGPRPRLPWIPRNTFEALHRRGLVEHELSQLTPLGVLVLLITYQDQIAVLTAQVFAS